MHIKNNNDHHLLLLLLVLLILLVILLFMLTKNRSSLYFAVNYKDTNKSMQKNNQTTRFMQKFTAGYLRFTIDVPEYFTMTDDFTFVDLDSKKGSVHIGRVASNFDNIEDYISFLVEKNHMQITEKHNFIINNRPAIQMKRLEQKNDYSLQRLLYFIYVDGWVYSFETNASALFGDLEKIVNSFQYQPK